MNKLENMLATYLHEEPEVVPQGINFVDNVTTRKLAPELLTIKDWRKKATVEARLLDNFSIGCGGGGFRAKEIKSSRDLGRLVAAAGREAVKSSLGYDLIETELGMIKRRYKLKNLHHASWRPAVPRDGADIRTLHDWTEIVKHPVEKEEDLDQLEFPNPDDPSRYEGVEENLRFFTDLGYMTTGGINGFFSAVWYEIMPFRLWLASLVRDKAFAKRVAVMNGEFNLRAAENLLERGVHCITWGDDMGYKKGMFFSREVYEDVIWPWHKKIADLVHKYGAFAEMHVDGNINAIMDLVVEAGIDAINNVGPGDNMDLAELKEKYGGKITLHGGLSRFTSRMSNEQLKAHIIDRIAIGSPGGGFILGQEGAIHSDMSPETFRFMMKVSRKYRRNRSFS
ncbi:MAG: uroporphyrinogen decarboxylase family protein [Candidatus Bathyarchaeota archaeon]|nr:uroporphyrinogen decarboxylase family protein [Candidatus Bathyarchaeota archaeon]MDH5687014.1 uroporphyrinogen decarboxylase family protein [Candidatus Bathyarchaeota archaeon]